MRKRSDAASRQAVDNTIEAIMSLQRWRYKENAAVHKWKDRLVKDNAGRVIRPRGKSKPDDWLLPKPGLDYYRHQIGCRIECYQLSGRWLVAKHNGVQWAMSSLATRVAVTESSTDFLMNSLTSGSASSIWLLIMIISCNYTIPEGDDFNRTIIRLLTPLLEPSDLNLQSYALLLPGNAIEYQ